MSFENITYLSQIIQNILHQVHKTLWMASHLNCIKHVCYCPQHSAYILILHI